MHIDKALVVAACNGEDISWTLPLVKEWTVFIETEYRPVGREAYAYLKWICAYHKNCPEIVVFCQGNPFIHCPDFIDQLEKGTSFGHLAGCDKNGLPQWDEDLNQWCRHFNLREQEEFAFIAGAQFKLSRIQVRKRSRHFYKNAFTLARENPRSGWILERLWPLIFGLEL